jgi:hypothetical protein
MVAGVRFELTTFGLCDLTQLSPRVALYLHPVNRMLATQSLRLPRSSEAWFGIAVAVQRALRAHQGRDGMVRARYSNQGRELNNRSSTLRSKSRLFDEQSSADAGDAQAARQTAERPAVERAMYMEDRRRMVRLEGTSLREAFLESLRGE